MPSSAPANHDPALSNQQGVPSAAQQAQQQGANLGPGGLPNGLQLDNLDPGQIMSLLRTIPGVFNKLADQKEDAAQTLSNLAQAPFPQGQHPLNVQQGPYGAPMHHGHAMPAISDPGPSSHPRGPPNLGQLSAAALQPTGQHQGQGQEIEEGGSDGDDGANRNAGGNATDATSTPPERSRLRGSRSATMGSDEWSRQRKDNHKEVERRRRGNINEGINELGRIVPNGSGEKAKGAILSRAVQYIHHLKENEARNIEKWTLEKLLMDQAMGDLQGQLDEMRHHWDEERTLRERLQAELEALRGKRSTSPEGGKEAGAKRRADGETEDDAKKRQRVE